MKIFSSSRQRFLKKYIIVYLALSLAIYFGLKFHLQENYQPQKINILTDTVSKFRDKTDDLCKYQMLGDPEVGTNYVKVSFWCQNDRHSNSTLALKAINGNTVQDVLKEYARIIGFDYELINTQNWYCLYDSQPISPDNLNQKIKPTTTIDCYQFKHLIKNDN